MFAHTTVKHSISYTTKYYNLLLMAHIDQIKYSETIFRDFNQFE